MIEEGWTDQNSKTIQEMSTTLADMRGKRTQIKKENKPEDKKYTLKTKWMMKARTNPR